MATISVLVKSFLVTGNRYGLQVHLRNGKMNTGSLANMIDITLLLFQGDAWNFMVATTVIEVGVSPNAWYYCYMPFCLQLPGDTSAMLVDRVGNTDGIRTMGLYGFS